MATVRPLGSAPVGLLGAGAGEGEGEGVGAGAGAVVDAAFTWMVLVMVEVRPLASVTVSVGDLVPSEVQVQLAVLPSNVTLLPVSAQWYLTMLPVEDDA